MIKLFKKSTDTFQNDDILQTKTNKFTFLVLILLLITHIFLMGLYIYVDAKILMLFNSISIAAYFYFLGYGIKKTKNFANFTFIEILLHMILAVISFGWAPGFQNWSYGLACAFFLPSLDPSNQSITSKRPIIIGIIFIVIYYSLLGYLYLVDKTIYTLHYLTVDALFIFNTLITFFGIIGFTYFYVTKSNIIENELSKRANYDELTTLYNRYALNYIGNSRLKKLDKNHSKLDVAIIDIDYFKNINDTYGHKVGDIVLEKLARTLRMYSIKDITCGRWGGEEFILISSVSINHNEFIKIIEELKDYVEEHEINIGRGKKINLTISAGIAQGTKKQNLEQVVSLADKNLYTAKESGRNRVVY